MTQKTFLFAGVFGFAIFALFVAAQVYAAAPVLSQTNVTVGLGQTATISSANTSVYLLSNSDPTRASVSANGTQVSVTGNQLGSTAASICTVGTANECTTLYVTVQVASVQPLTLSQTTLSLSIGQNQAITVSGGNGSYFLSGNSSTSVVSATLSSSTLTLSGLSAGGATVTVCDTANSCGSTSVTVSTAANSSTAQTNQYVNFNPSSPAVVVGQTTVVSLSSSYSTTAFFLNYNSDPNVLQASITSNTLSLYGLKAGSATITVCVAGEGCNQLVVAVTGAGTASQNTTQTTTQAQQTITQTQTQTTTQQASSADLGALLAQIQAMQSQLAQIATQIQSMASTLSQLASRVVAQLKQTSAAGGSTTFSGTFTQYLGIGSEGAEVTALQKLLAKLGFYSGSVTGYYGSLTEAAVKAYQSARGIDAVGFVGPGTRAALNAEK